MTTGPATFPADPSQLLTCYTQALTMSGSDAAMSTYFNCGYCRRLVPQANGTLYVQRQGDAGYTPWVVTAGVPLDGQFMALGAASDFITVNLEL